MDNDHQQTMLSHSTGMQNSVQDLVPIIAGTCAVTAKVYGANFSITPFNAVQYYRESSFALSLDGYNNAFPDIEVPISSEGFTIPAFQ
jgi:hypothetical protein